MLATPFGSVRYPPQSSSPLRSGTRARNSRARSSTAGGRTSRRRTRRAGSGCRSGRRTTRSRSGACLPSVESGVELARCTIKVFLLLRLAARSQTRSLVLAALLPHGVLESFCKPAFAGKGQTRVDGSPRTRVERNRLRARPTGYLNAWLALGSKHGRKFKGIEARERGWTRTETTRQKSTEERDGWPWPPMGRSPQEAGRPRVKRR